MVEINPPEHLNFPCFSRNCLEMQSMESLQHILNRLHYKSDGRRIFFTAMNPATFHSFSKDYLEVYHQKLAYLLQR